MCRLLPLPRSPRLALLAALAASVVAAATGAAAATFRVDRTDDEPAASACEDAAPNDCSLRGATLRANAANEPSTIELPAGRYPITQTSSCTYRSAGHPFPVTDSFRWLCLTKEVAIVGAGAGETFIDGELGSRLLYVDLDATVEISGVTLERGQQLGAYAWGGGIRLDGGRLTLRSVVVRSNTTSATGGGVHSVGTLAVYGSLFEANVAGDGGAVWVEAGSAAFADSRFTGNTGGSGGAMFLNRSTLVGSVPVPVSITGCLVDGNESSLGAIFNYRADTVVTNTTISGNRAIGGAGGLGVGLRVQGGTADLRNLTITDNEGFLYGGGLSIHDTTVRMRNSIVAGNYDKSSGAPADCLAPPEFPLVSEGYNLIGDTVGCNLTGDATGNVLGQPALLGALAPNGGPTLTHAPGTGSPALEGGSPAQPGSREGAACAATDQRGLLRPEGARCDMGALEKPPGLGLAGVEPRRGGNAGSVVLRAFGSGFEPGATLRLVRAGDADVVADAAAVDLGGSAIAARVDLAGRAPAVWDVVVQNPGGASATLAQAFTVEAGGGPELWVAVTGRSFVRSLRAASIVVQVGNRGNVDAVGVPVSLSFPDDVRASLHGDILGPPAQPGRAFEDWSYVPLQVTADPSRFDVPLLVPLLPAGSTRSLRLRVVVEGPSPDDRVLTVAAGDPTLQGGVDAAAVARRVEAALATVERTAGVPIPTSVVAQLRSDVAAYVTAQGEAILAEASAGVAGELGTAPRVYAIAQLEADAAYFAALRAGDLLIEELESAGALAPAVREALLLASQAIGRALAAVGPAPATAAIPGQQCPATQDGGANVMTVGTFGGGGGCTGSAGPDEIGPKGPPPNPTCFQPLYKLIAPESSLAERQQARRDLGECAPGVAECESLPDHEILFLGGAPVCVPKDKDKCKIKCTPFPIRPVVSFDPNDKVGRLGGGEERWVSDRAPFVYTVFFENLETASAAAQEVVITDPLDTTKLDLSTLALGPIAFADSTVTPAPGVQAWSGGVDLRPEQDLIVSIDAALDEATGVVTWRFRSLDPATLELTDDPLAGFLAPNVTPPEGDGSVSFTIAAKPELADGDSVCNGASIVFDINEPIVTPTFCNTLDETPPESEVEALPPVSPAEPFVVRWTSTDAGSGVAGTTVFVSVNGAPYEVFVDAGPGETSAELTPEPGKLYAFYGVAADVAGNLEAEPDVADAETTTEGAGDHDLAVLSVKAPRRVALTAKRPTRSAQVKLVLQSRSPHPETIATLEELRALATVRVDSLGACPDATAVLREAPLARKLPIAWKPKKKLRLAYEVAFDCANDGTAGTPDYEVSARVQHLALGGADAHPQDDFCPRTGSPPGEVDAFPDGRITDRGCGAKLAGGARGGALTVDVTAR